MQIFAHMFCYDGKCNWGGLKSETPDYKTSSAKWAMSLRQQYQGLLSLADAETGFTRDAFPYCLMNDLNLHLEKSLPGVWGNSASALAGSERPRAETASFVPVWWFCNADYCSPGTGLRPLNPFHFGAQVRLEWHSWKEKMVLSTKTSNTKTTGWLRHSVQCRGINIANSDKSTLDFNFILIQS